MSAQNYQRSRQVLQSLVQGLDPETGQELRGDTVLNRVDVVRALLTALGALESINARMLRRAQLPESVGKSWSSDEEWSLTEEYQKQGMSISDIAIKHGRTMRAIETRLEKLGLIKPEDRTTSSSFIGTPSRRGDIE